ncbi:MAG: bifunctional diaminohydroxyphosphoribosylaminopyrimidine deaminase/5-amino-6-(5-phosphoribosylamino)uracil reductase RibD [Phycisphaerae bacterium]|nr:bifunctional diaminohydroxyphosphoribosylaminopyrimidine deaminase/5-amino-6-(5-phosphoribosylamino)uracil reductase RibD [Phycisphaerae bacterium]
MSSERDIKIMQMALLFARKGLGSVEPNPAVGCVIVKGDTILGTGFHERFGEAHAEVNALADCKARGNDPAGATMYVTLEPCSHTGKTPPCSQAVINAKIARVVIAAEDPTDLAGGGIEMLKQAGIEVEVGLCRDEAEKLNAPFYKYARTGLPWVIVKWAQSKDGYLARKNAATEGNWISNEQSRADVHKLRKRTQAILTGVDTVIADNPKLTVRIEAEAIDRPPLRVVVDSQLRIPPDCHLVMVPDAPTIVVTTARTAQAETEKVQNLRDAGIEVLPVPAYEDHCDLGEALILLGARGIQQLLIEAGPTLITELLNQNLADEVRIYIAPFTLGANGTASASETMKTLANRQELKDVKIDTFDTDICIRGYLEVIPKPLA